jgi:hypothetical protein
MSLFDLQTLAFRGLQIGHFIAAILTISVVFFLKASRRRLTENSFSRNKNAVLGSLRILDGNTCKA